MQGTHFISINEQFIVNYSWFLPKKGMDHSVPLICFSYIKSLCSSFIPHSRRITDETDNFFDNFYHHCKVQRWTEMSNTSTKMCCNKKHQLEVEGGGGIYNGACAYYVMVSKIQWKPFWLADQLYPQNDWTGWRNGVKYDIIAQALLSCIAIMYQFW